MARPFWLALAPAVALLAPLGCKPAPAPVAPVAAQTEAQPAIVIDALRKHVGFLAADAQEGRAPGTKGDEATQGYVEAAMRSAGLEPGFGQDFRQIFEVTDGVRIRPGADAVLDSSGIMIPHHLVPFTTDTTSAGPALAKMVFVGFGIAGGSGSGDGDYAGLRVKGRIVVALHGGSGDPHQSPASLRPQSKLIAARDRGAVGFVLWDPSSTSDFPNHGEASDLKLPSVFVSGAGNEALLRAFGVRKPPASPTPKAPGLRRGAVSKKPTTLQTEVERVVLKTANVAGFVRGSGGSDKVVVVGAHMDHLGRGTASSLAPGDHAVHNGADDNASGVAVMLEICRALGELPASQRPYDVMCAAFGAEEMGLLGSKFLVDNVPKELKARMIAMINFDMVGRLDKGALVVAGVGTSSAWPALVDAHRGTLDVSTSEGGYGPSDHGSFYAEGMPVLHFFTGPHADYHKPSDDLDKLNFAGAAQVGQMALAIISQLLEEQVTLDYKQTKRAAPQGGRQFRVSLGSIPDYAAKVDGVRLSGVRKGGAAAEAGLRKGDVIKKIGKREIHNLDDYMACFAELEPGEAAPVVIDRDGKTVELTLVPSAPRPR